jgi:phosphate-selective porin OprO/OprP
MSARIARTIPLLLAALLAAAPARAGESALMRLIEVLRQNGTLDADTYAALRETAEAEESRAPQAESTRVSFGEDGLEVKSADGDFEVQLGGRLHVDGSFFREEDEGLGNNTAIRRLRAEISGRIWRDWSFSSGIEFGEDGEIELKSNYLSYEGFEWADLTIGKFKEPFSLEELSSSNDMTFMERAGVNVFTPGRTIGVGADAHGDHWTAAAGVFGSEEDLDHEEEIDESWAVTGRGTWAPFVEEGRVLHLGASASHRDFNSGATLDFGEDLEEGITDVDFLDTGTLDEVDRLVRVGAELATVYGPFSFQAEYIRAMVDRGAGLSDADFDGWYAYASWVITGESRPYRKSKGVMGSVQPRRRLDEGGPGAWEVAVRFSRLDLTDGDVDGGARETLTLGLNWYVNPNVRFMANYMRVLDLEGGPLDGDDPDAFLLRAQLAF